MLRRQCASDGAEEIQAESNNSGACDDEEEVVCRPPETSLRVSDFLVMRLLMEQATRIQKRPCASKSPCGVLSCATSDSWFCVGGNFLRPEEQSVCLEGSRVLTRLLCFLMLLMELFLVRGPVFLVRVRVVFCSVGGPTVQRSSCPEDLKR